MCKVQIWMIAITFSLLLRFLPAGFRSSTTDSLSSCGTSVDLKPNANTNAVTTRTIATGIYRANWLLASSVTNSIVDQINVEVQMPRQTQQRNRFDDAALTYTKYERHICMMIWTMRAHQARGGVSLRDRPITCRLQARIGIFLNLRPG